MRIALPIADGKFSTHYGRAQALSLHDIDLETGAAIDVGVMEFPEAGTCSAAPWVASQGVEILLVGGLGAGAAQGLGNAGVKVFAGIQEEDPAKVVEMFLAGLAQARELAPGESLCEGHEEGHEHEHGHHHGEGHVCTCGG
jgi:predicted Fe-Mo cluster-binding NifX family protein